MLDMAIYGKGDLVRIKDIAERQDISDKYLEQIVSTLNKAGFVKSIRGPQGGYRLTREPEQYTVGMILRLTEGNLAPVACLDDVPDASLQSQNCVTFDVWIELNDAINKVVDNITLEDLVERQLAKAGNDYMI